MTWPWAAVIIASLAFLAYLIKLGESALQEQLERRSVERRQTAAAAMRIANDEALRASPIFKALSPQMEQLAKAMNKLGNLG